MLPFDPYIPVGDKVISAEHPVFIIAEAGVNHGGDLDLALKLIDVAVEAGADAVKFQSFRAEHLILDSVSKAPYQTKTTSASESQFDMLKRLEVSRDQNQKLMDYCKQKGIIFLTTPFEEVSLDELDELDLDAYKIASTDTTNIPFLEKVARKGKPMFLSTGMTHLGELAKVLDYIYPINQQVVLLACTANYPIKDEEANLRTIDAYHEHFDCLVGYSDHSVGVGAAPYAVPMGAVVLEKHFTTSKELEGPDHRASLSPDELGQFVKDVRRIETYLGSPHKLPTLSELRTRASLQKGMVATRAIAKGELFSTENIIGKRTGGKGISPLYFYEVVGQPAPRDFEANDIIDVV